MLLIIGYSVWHKWVFETVGPIAHTVGYLFLDRSRPGNESSRCLGNRQWRMCDCETNCLNCFLHRLSRLSDNEISLNRLHALSYGMLPTTVCAVLNVFQQCSLLLCYYTGMPSRTRIVQNWSDDRKKYSKHMLFIDSRCVGMTVAVLVPFHSRSHYQQQLWGYKSQTLKLESLDCDQSCRVFKTKPTKLHRQHYSFSFPTPFP